MEDNNVPNNLPVEYVADFLSISKSTIYEMVRRKQIPSFRIGQRIVIPKEMFFAWVKEQAQVSNK